MTNKAENNTPEIIANINGINVTKETKLAYVAENPKRKNSKARDRFGKYMKAKTVAEFYELGGTRADLRYDQHHEFVKILSEK